MTALGKFVLTDETHLALQRLQTSPPEYAIIPASDDLTGSSLAFSAWVLRAGGLRGASQQDFSAATNPFAGQSCALGADGSSAAWRHDDAQSFLAPPPRVVPATNDESSAGDLLFVEIFCLVAEGRQYIAVAGLEGTAPVGRRSVVLIYEAGQGQLLEKVNLALEGNEPLPYLRQVGTDMLVGIQPSSDLDREGPDRPWVATRIRFADGEWRAEHALLSQNPNTGRRAFRLIGARRTDLLFSTTDGVFSVPWPEGVSSIPFAPVQVLAAQSDFERSVLRAGEVIISPSGNRIAWVDRRGSGELRVVSAPAPLQR